MAQDEPVPDAAPVEQISEGRGAGRARAPDRRLLPGAGRVRGPARRPARTAAPAHRLGGDRRRGGGALGVRDAAARRHRDPRADPGGAAAGRAGAPGASPRSPTRSSSSSSAASCSPRRCSCTAWIGASPSPPSRHASSASSAARALVVYGAVTTFLSMWISNVATTAMMFPIGLAMSAQLVADGGDGAADARSPAAVQRFALGDDADHVVRRLGRRHGDAGRHAAEPDRDGADRARRRPPHRLRRVDGDWGSGDGDSVCDRRGDVRWTCGARPLAVARRPRRRAPRS